MINTKFTAGLLVATLLIGTVPVAVLASAPAADTNYITGTTYSFAAGAHSAINETVVLNDTTDNTLYAGVAENETPVVAEPEATQQVAGNPYANIAIAQVNASLNIRAEANAESEVLGKLYSNGAATVLESLDGWYKITSGSVTGYVSADYVVVGDEAACKAASQRIATITTNTLRLRKEASTDAGVYTLLSGGNKVTVVDESVAGWLKVQYKSYTGYISADYATVETVYTYAESKEEEAARLAAEREEAERKAAEKANKKKKQSSSSSKTYNPPVSGNGQGVVDYAVQFIGNPYKWAGTSLTNGADCSGFVMKVYEAFGISLPHSSYKMRSVGYRVGESEIQPGDIVCYSGHVAIYMGGGKIVHASNKKDGIKITNNWKYKRVLAIRRVI